MCVCIYIQREMGAKRQSGRRRERGEGKREREREQTYIRIYPKNVLNNRNKQSNILTHINNNKKKMRIKNACKKTRTHTHTHTHTNTHTNIHTFTRKNTCICMHLRIYPYTHLFVGSLGNHHHLDSSTSPKADATKLLLSVLYLPSSTLHNVLSYASLSLSGIAFSRSIYDYFLLCFATFDYKIEHKVHDFSNYLD